MPDDRSAAPDAKGIVVDAGTPSGPRALQADFFLGRVTCGTVML